MRASAATPLSAFCVLARLESTAFFVRCHLLLRSPAVVSVYLKVTYRETFRTYKGAAPQFKAG